MGGMGETINPHGIRVGIIKVPKTPDEFDIKIADCKKERDRLIAKATSYDEVVKIRRIYAKRIELFKQKQSKNYGNDSNGSQPIL